MSAPYDNYDAPHAPSAEGLLAAEDLRQLPGSWFAHCEGCGETTMHVSWSDDHGCEFASGCRECRLIVKYHGCAYGARQRAAVQPRRRAS